MRREVTADEARQSPPMLPEGPPPEQVPEALTTEIVAPESTSVSLESVITTANKTIAYGILLALSPDVQLTFSEEKVTSSIFLLPQSHRDYAENGNGHLSEGYNELPLKETGPAISSDGSDAPARGWEQLLVHFSIQARVGPTIHSGSIAFSKSALPRPPDLSPDTDTTWGSACAESERDGGVLLSTALQTPVKQNQEREGVAGAPCPAPGEDTGRQAPTARSAKAPPQDLPSASRAILMPSLPAMELTGPRVLVSQAQ
ncbi:hypothetical protein CB1_001793022 [Camelus ferus]|nr:hypothetical protein CB1_001793022 [Camelus ferus]